ncbi:PAAR domain-containing protein [Paraburkholderia sp. A1RI-2L]|uniref:PAAR domain-containing protein n=1 Tax=Paraburkholderia sp. A1RI-2L TaxID=3028367 RepID=UPI003B80C83C
MKRALLRQWDKSTSGGVVREGIENCTHHGRAITFIGAKVWCACCKSEGLIGAKGPHQNATMHGKQQALDGDICLCQGDPPPVMIASQDSAWHTFESQELTGTGYGAGNAFASIPPGSMYDEQFTLCDAHGSLMPDTYYTVRLPSGALEHGVTDSQGRTARYTTQSAQSIRFYLGHRDEV